MTSFILGELAHALRYLASVVSQSFMAFGDILELHKKFLELSGGINRIFELDEFLEASQSGTKSIYIFIYIYICSHFLLLGIDICYRERPLIIFVLFNCFQVLAQIITEAVWILKIEFPFQRWTSLPQLRS